MARGPGLRLCRRQVSGSIADPCGIGHTGHVAGVRVRGKTHPRLGASVFVKNISRQAGKTNRKAYSMQRGSHFASTEQVNLENKRDPVLVFYFNHSHSRITASAQVHAGLQEAVCRLACSWPTACRRRWGDVSGRGALLLSGCLLLDGR